MTPPAADRRAIDWPLFALAFLAAAAIFILRDRLGAADAPLLADTDDAMRMVVVRDLLAGQGWYDIVQHRLNTPWGAEIHWSRLIDLPIALLILVARPFAGPAGAEIFAAYAWPLLLFAVLLWVSARFALRLAGPAGLLPALILPILSPAVTNEFPPGRIDHHNVQIVLTLAIAWAAVESLKRPGFAVLAGVLCATALAIGTESLPAIAAAILAYGLVWIFMPDGSRPVRDFGLSFAGAALVHLAIALPPERWLAPACDALSISYVTAAAATGTAFVALAALGARPRGWPLRFALGIGAGLAAMGLVFALFPECLKGPYAAVAPWLVTNWIDAIAEAKPWWASLFELPAYTLAVGIPPLLGLAVICRHAFASREGRAEWLVLALFLGFATLVMLLQVRGARLATMPAIPAAAWLIAGLQERYLTTRAPGAGAALVAGWFGFAGVLVTVAVSAVVWLVPSPAQQVMETRAERAQCLMPPAFADLAALPPERIMAPIDLGSHLLLETPHSVVAAPYHRNEAGVLDAFAFFNAPVAEARGILDRRGIGLVVVCPAMPEMLGLADAADDSFVRLRAAGALPPWLADVSLGGPLEVYAVLPDASAR
ncbi:hypothetical protein [Devosia geojensis]|nr:hypothetical protein [Devosia geojensis]